MKRVIFITMICALFALPISAQMTKPELQQMYLDYLQKAGYNTAAIDEDGDIEFTYRYKTLDLPFYIIVHEDDQEYFQIYLDGFWSIESEQEKWKALTAASYVNGRRWVAKVYLNSAGNNVRCSAEALITEPGKFAGIFTRLLEQMDSALSDFAAKMQ